MTIKCFVTFLLFNMESFIALISTPFDKIVLQYTHTLHTGDGYF